MKVNFKKIIIQDINGNDLTADFQGEIGNNLYMHGQNIEECELGKRIYFADGEIELTAGECETVKRYTAGYSYVARTAIEKAMKGGE